MNLDLHVHTRRFSACSLVTPEQILDRVKESVLDGVVFTEHDRFWPRDELDRYRARYPEVTIFNGAEITVPSLHHVLTIVPEPEPDLLDPDTPRDFLKKVERNGGIAIAAHPFRIYTDYHLRNRETSLHGVEIASSNMASAWEETQSRELARTWSASKLMNSDAHSLVPLGMFYNRFDQVIETEKELIEAIRAGTCEPVRTEQNDEKM